MQSPRRISLDYLRQSNIPSVDPTGESAVEPNSPEALQLIKDMKPSRYAALASLTDAVLTTMFTERPNRPPHGFINSAHLADGPWEQLRLDSLTTAFSAIDNECGSKVYWRAQHYNTLTGKLDENRWISVETQMQAGFDTAASSMLNLLRNIPQILSAHGLSDANPATTARASVGLPWRLAIGNVPQLLAARQVLEIEDPNRFWSDVNVHIRPEWFTLKTHNDSTTVLAFNGLFDTIMPIGYTPSHFYVEGLKDPTPIHELGEPEATVGCPVTLLSRRLHGLWDWYIDVIDAKSMWQSD